MENLSYETALDIFESQYWNAQNLGLLTHQSIANILYDGCVNQGQGAMANVLEEAASRLGVKIEGNVFSEENISIINGLDQEKLFKEIKEIREEMYRNNDRFDDFGDGWLDRLSRIEFGDDSNNNIA
jgi:lysozyme family protein